MELGDVIESAIWLNGEETYEHRVRFERDVHHAIDRLCDKEGWLRGPVKFVEKRPGEDRVPVVPDDIQGQRVRLLVGEAEIVGKKPETSRGSFIVNLDRSDLVRLRKLTRDARRKAGCGREINDRECDEIIEHCGPEAALETLRRRDTLQ